MWFIEGIPRIISDDTVIDKAYLTHGLLPKGGGTFFLTRLLGPSEAYRLLLSHEPLTANQALELGLVDRVVPASMLLEAAFDKARAVAALPQTTVSGIKRLINWDQKALREFLETENTEFQRILSRRSIW